MFRYTPRCGRRWPAMSSTWPAVELGSSARLVRRAVGASECRGKRYVGLEHIGEGTLAITSTGDGDLVESAKSEFRAGDILFGKLRPYFRKVAIAPFDGVCSTDIWVVRPVRGVDPRFLFYRLASTEFVEAASRGAEGTRMPRAKWGFVSRLAFPLPPLAIQKRIAQILGTFDDKIELNRRMNETLEAMARAIFKSWFVDFDPVHAKAAGRDTGLPKRIADLFPSGFQSSELGLIPKGWEVATVSDVAGLNLHCVRSDYPYEQIEYVDISSVSAGRLCQTARYGLRDAPSRAQRLVRHGDTIWSCVRPNRRSFLFIQFPPENLVVSTGFAVITPRRATPSYLHAWVTADSFVDYLAASADGSAYPAVRPEYFARAAILVPPPAVLAAHEGAVGPLHAASAKSWAGAERLALLRDTLLPKLLSGELPVPEAETIISEVT